jgi:glycosyltransferase involved in cell wall biosynthesis
VQHLAERLRILPHCDCLPDLLREVGVVWQSGDVAYGGAIVDALAAGKPVVAVESDAAWQLIVGGETGWIVPPLPESEFPRRALSLIEDAALATRFVEAGRARAAAVFSRDRFVAQLLEAVA